MPLLSSGTLVDQFTITLAGIGRASAELFLTNNAHSLPATNPEDVALRLTSIEDVSGVIGMAPDAFSPGGNASQVTVGFLRGHNSAASVATIAAVVTSRVYYSTVR